MHGLFRALALLPAVVSAAPFVPDDQVDQEWDRRAVKSFTEARVVARVDIQVPSKSHDVDPTSLGFQIEVLNSETACGFGNVTIDGKILPQTVNGDMSTGKGTVSTNTKGVVIGSWNFKCIRINGIPNAQLLKFTINYVDGMPMEDSGFSMLFRQSGMAEIVNMETDLSIPDELVANPSPEALQPEFGNYHKHHGGIEDDFAELDYLRSQLREIKFLIYQKERSIAHRARQYHETDIKTCDSLKCVVKAMAHRAKHAAFDIYGMISGDDKEVKHGQHYPDGPFRELRGHTGDNHSRHGNHGHHLPPWKRPHSRPLPICRYPPPGYHRPSHHGPPLHQSPHHAPDISPPEFDITPHHHMPSPPPGIDKPPHHGHNGEKYNPHHRRPGFDHSPPSSPPQSDHPPPPPHQRRPSHNLRRILLITKFTSIGFLCAFLIGALHRRVCTPSRRADRHERRRRRRALRRAAHKHIITRLLARIAGSGGNEDDDEDYEKKEALLGDAEDGISTTMSEDIEEFRNAAEVVGDMVGHVSSADGEIRAYPAYLPTQPSALVQTSEPLSIPVSNKTPLLQESEEELPAYEDNDVTEMDSVISDGYRPGMLYTPSQSSEGSLNENLGPDTKS